MLLNQYFDEAVLWAQRYLQASPDDAEILYEYGLALGRVGELDFAITLLNRALNAGKDRFAVHWRRGYLEFLRGNLPAAMDDLVKAIALKNDPYVRQLLQASVIPALPPGIKWAGMTGRYVSLRYTLPHRLHPLQDASTSIRHLLSDDGDAVVTLVDAETCPDRRTVVDDETAATLHPIMQTGPHITNPLFIGSIKNARVFNSRLWDRNGDLVIESVAADMANVEVDRLRDEHILYRTAHPLVLSSIGRPAENVVTIQETCVLLDNEWAGNYTHWHLQMLAAYSLLRETIVTEGLKVLVTAPDGFRRDSLAAAGIPANSIHFMQPDTVYRVPRLLFPSFAWAFHVGNILLFPKQAMEIFARIRAGAAAATGAHRRIYVARFEATGRSLENERELADRLSTLGFEIVVTEQLPFAEEVKTFAEADLVVGPHGSGLTNCLYCRPGATAIELTHRDFFNPPPPTVPSSHFVIEPSMPLPTPQIPSWGYGHLFAAADLNGVQYLEHSPANITISSYYHTIPNFTWRIDVDKAVSFISRFLG